MDIRRTARNVAKILTGLILAPALTACFLIPVDPSITEPPRTDYLDVHVHAAGLGEGGSGAFISEAMRKNIRFPIYLRAFGITKKEVAEHGDGLLIRRISEHIEGSRRVSQAVVLALDGVVKDGELDREATQVYVPNEFIAQETAKYPSLLFGASINPHRADALERLQWAHANGAVLVKWIPSIMDIDPSDPALTDFYRKLVELDMPLLSHAGRERAFATAIKAYDDPQLLRLPLSLGVRVIAAHAATLGRTEGEKNFDRFVPMIDEYPNLYTDISTLTQVSKLSYMKRTLAVPGLGERLVYGTDWPLQFFPLVSSYYYVGRLGIRKARSIAKIDNVWDRDVALKEALGTPGAVFTRSRDLLLGGREDEDEGEAAR